MNLRKNGEKELKENGQDEDKEKRRSWSIENSPDVCFSEFIPVKLGLFS